MEPLLIRVGMHTINLANVAYILEEPACFRVVFTTADVGQIILDKEDAKKIENLLNDAKYCYQVPEDATPERQFSGH